VRLSIKSLVTIGVRFIENGNMCKVTRVTDVDFDTLDTVSGNVTVRNLKAWESERFVNSISGVTGLLKIRGGD
jgi:hypothetical protein